MKTNNRTTLIEAKKFLRDNYKKGTTCPCCAQPVKMYRRPITSAMAIGLITLYKEKELNITHIEDFFKLCKELPSSIRGDFPKLRYWDIIELVSEQDGYYKITKKGERFVKGNEAVKSHVLLYNNKSYGLDGNLITINECLNITHDNRTKITKT